MSEVMPLSNVDAAWLRMEHPTNLMMVSGIMTFDKPIDVEHLKAVVKYRLLKFGRFRQRVVQPRLPLGPYYWEDDPFFDLDHHLQRMSLPGEGSYTALQNVVSDLMSTPLDFSRPLWQLHLIENYGDGCAIMSRLHHCIADGMALMYVLLSLTDFSPDAPWPTTKSLKGNSESEGVLGGTLGALFKRASSAVNIARDLTERLIREGRETLIHPTHIIDLAKQSGEAALSTGRLVLRTPDPHTLFKGELGRAKRAAWSRPLPLKEVKAIKNVTGTTVNDVLVTAMAGGLRRYLLSRGASVNGLNFRAAVPVNLREPDEVEDLGNKFGLVFLSLPIGIGDTMDRLMEVSERMNALKNSSEATVAIGILSAMGMTPNEIQDVLVKMFGAKATAVMTNVPGPPMPLYLAGQKISGLMFWVPQSGRLGLGVSIISYAGKVWLGVATDAGLVPDPNTIIEGFYDEYDSLLELVQVAETAEKAKKRASPPQNEKAPVRCQAITKKGTQCKNRSLDGSSFCHVHQKATETV